METFNLFVYGTLKKGQTSEKYLTDAEFLGKAVSKESKFFMVCMKAFWYPFVFNNGDKKISGEIYKVPVEKLKELDYYEGYQENRNGLYIRDSFDYVLENGETVNAIMYYVSTENMNGIKLENNTFSWN